MDFLRQFFKSSCSTFFCIVILVDKDFKSLVLLVFAWSLHIEMRCMEENLIFPKTSRERNCSCKEISHFIYKWILLGLKCLAEDSHSAKCFVTNQKRNLTLLSSKKRSFYSENIYKHFMQLFNRNMITFLGQSIIKFLFT